MCAGRGTVTATRVGSQQSADPQKGNAQAKKPSRIPRQQPFLKSPASDGILDPDLWVPFAAMTQAQAEEKRKIFFEEFADE